MPSRHKHSPASHTNRPTEGSCTIILSKTETIGRQLVQVRRMNMSIPMSPDGIRPLVIREEEYNVGGSTW